MLTGNLLRFTRRKGKVVPSLVDPLDPVLSERVASLLCATQSHLGGRRGDLEQALDLLAPADAAYGAERGLVKLLLDRCVFETRAGYDPVRVREEVFERAAAAWRTQPLVELPRWRTEVLREAGVAVSGKIDRVSSEEVEIALYADLEEDQILVNFDPISPERLLLRYNVSLVQGLLLCAESLEIQAEWPDSLRLRQLFRWLKFFGLLFEVGEETGPGPAQLHLSVNGPLSVIEHGSRYGLNLAQFFGALLLWPDAWVMTARIRIGRRSQIAELALQPSPWLKSSLPDHGAWVPDSVRDFVELFGREVFKHGSSWTAAPAERIVCLQGNRYLIPDFEFTESGTGRRVLMQHVLYPAPERVGRLLEMARLAESVQSREGPVDSYWVACRRVHGLPEDFRLVSYRRSLLPSQVRERLEALSA